MSPFFGKSVPDSMALIAGEGEFPLLIAEAAAKRTKLYVFGVEGSADPRLEQFAAQVVYVKLGELKRLVELLKKTGVRSAVLAGGVPKERFYDPAFQADDTARGFMGTVRNQGDDHLLKAFALYLKIKCGVSVLDSRLFLSDVLCPKGLLTQRAPTAAEQNDLKYGWKIVKAVGKMDIGQTVVVKKGNVLAVEAIEGTNRAVRRGGELGSGGAVIVKAAKPGQDLRFDLPCVGLETLQTMKEVSRRVLGVEAGKTVLIDKKRLIETADRENITLMGL